ncbi:MAG: hypothetical protein A3D90_12010 [Sulfuricurvum sp. RIFCSPHIGHO2_02_FULL_43_9]|nr:MAG: hypothetical protein A3D90_12010 [Sulfuricurvum sp. RIFCSPHIGHO2_02_FULL_43_9]
MDKHHAFGQVLSTGIRQNLPKGVVFIHGNCQDEGSIGQLQSTKFDAILHIAGQSSGEISFDDPVYDLKTNTESTLRLIQYALAHDCSRFIYASSMSVYGEAPGHPIAEDFPCKPLSFYGIGKLASEHYMRIYQSKGIKSTALRYFNVYGPNQNMSNLRQGMVSIYLAQLLQSSEIVVKGAKDRFRDFIYIDDVVDFTLGILHEPKSHGGVYNVGTGVKTTVEELLLLLMEISGIYKPVSFSQCTPGDQKGIYADTNLISDIFGFKHRFDLKNGLKEMIEWAKANMDAGVKA